MKITYIGHATTLIEIDGKHILTDPYYAHRLFVLPRFSKPGVIFEHLPKIDCILQSHAHFDHLHKPTLRRFPLTTPIRAARGVHRILDRMGFTDASSMHRWDSETVSGLKITCVPAQHFGGRILLVGVRLGWCGFVVEGKEGTVYFAGDTAYAHKYFKKIAEQFRIDVAILPIGAHRPRMFLKYWHMNPSDALQAFQDLGADHLIPIHWGTFRLGFESMLSPVHTLDSLARLYGLSHKVHILHPGEHFDLNRHP